MWRFILRRLLLIIPTLFLVLSIIFILVKSLPGDPVMTTLKNHGSITNIGQQDFDYSLYNQTAENLNLHKPTFYFSIIPANIPNSIYTLPYLQRKFAFNTIDRFGSPKEVLALTAQMTHILDDPGDIPTGIIDHLGRYSTDLVYLDRLLSSTSPKSDDVRLSSLHQILSEILSESNRYISMRPKLIWHGLNNQYHDWLRGAFLWQLGNSSRTGRPVSQEIKQAFMWTLAINLFSIPIGYILAVIIGVYAGWKSQLFDKLITAILYLIYSIPVFWLTTILVVFFSTPEYGEWTNIFAAVGILNPSQSLVEILTDNLKYLAIPIFVLSTNLMAYIARIVRNSIAEEKNKTYVQYARTKGLSENYILWRHVFRNASFPLITLLASVLPAALAGSLVIEIICNIHGSGRLLFTSIEDQDWNVVNGIVMTYTFLTILGLLISDILYRWADPRVKWNEE